MAKLAPTPIKDPRGETRRAIVSGLYRYRVEWFNPVTRIYNEKTSDYTYNDEAEAKAAAEALLRVYHVPLNTVNWTYR